MTGCGNTGQKCWDLRTTVWHQNHCVEAAVGLVEPPSPVRCDGACSLLRAWDCPSVWLWQWPVWPPGCGSHCCHRIAAQKKKGFFYWVNLIFYWLFRLWLPDDRCQRWAQWDCLSQLCVWSQWDTSPCCLSDWSPWPRHRTGWTADFATLSSLQRMHLIM